MTANPTPGESSPEALLQGGTILAVYRGGAKGEAAVQEALIEARRRNAKVEVVGVPPSPGYTAVAAAGGMVLCAASVANHPEAIRCELAGAMSRVPADIPVRFSFAPGGLRSSVDLDSYVLVTGLRRRRPRRLHLRVPRPIGLYRRPGRPGPSGDTA